MRACVRLCVRQALKGKKLSACIVTTKNVAEVMDMKAPRGTKIPDDDLDAVVLLTHNEALFEELFKSLPVKDSILYGETRTLLWEVVGHVSLVRLLLTNPDIEPNLGLHVPDVTTQTPLHKCIARQEVDSALELLRHPKIDVGKPSIINGQQHLPLIQALGTPCIQVCIGAQRV